MAQVYGPVQKQQGRSMVSGFGGGGGPLSRSGIFGFQAPTVNVGAYNPEPAMGMYKDIFDRATTGSINSFDTAANRLRERLDSASVGQYDTARNANLSRGFGASGINDKSMNDVGNNFMFNYSQGLNDLSNQFETQRLTGLGIGNQSAQGVAGEQQFGFSKLLEQALANAQNKTSVGISKMNNQTAMSGQNNSLIEMLMKALSSYGQ